MKVTAPLPEGRSLIAVIDPRTPARHSPLQRALRAASIGHGGVNLDSIP